MTSHRWLGWIARLYLFWAFLAIAQIAGMWAERGLLVFALVGALGAMPRWKGRSRAGPFAVASLGAALASLAVHFLNDGFSYRYVWLLSAPQLEPWLKLANIWSGDEGTLMLLGLIGLGLAIRLDRYGGWAGPGAYLLAAVFILGALLWDPFVATPAASLAEQPYRGANAHLTSVWMAVHPPLVFFSYMLLVSPWAAMVEALARRRGRWREIAGIYGRGGWLLLSAGIGFGMWWAYLDFAYGTLWHWDPVQTASFAGWAFLTAMLHAQRHTRPDDSFSIVHPALGLLTAASMIGVMAITRSATLASSHRYVGDTSLPLLAGLAGAMLVALVVSLIWRLKAGGARPRAAGERQVLIWAAIGIFTACGLVAGGQIAIAYGSSALGLPRPDDLKPFFETLRNFASADELSRLRAAFAQWDINNFAANRWLAPLGGLIGLLGGHYFLPLRRRWRWRASLAVLAAGLASSFWVQPFGRLFEGTGLTSGKTVDIFPLLDFLIVSLAYLVLAIILWAGAGALRSSARVTWRYWLPIGAIHLGVMIALAGALASTIFDSYAKRVIPVRAGFTEPVLFPGGYRLRIDGFQTTTDRDGVRGKGGTFRSVARIEWSLTKAGRVVTRRRGHAVYRDERPPYSEKVGSIRLMCEIIDYRYARYASGARQMIHPLISRGFWRDVQIWVPAVSNKRDRVVGAGEKPGSVPVILKIFPLMSFVWIGLLMALLGFIGHYLAELAILKSSDRETE
ncbi:MAG: cytochrome c biogenesis protein CcsA [Alphaproteobacteria bacterium]